MAILDEIGRQRTAEYGGVARKDIRALPEKVDENTPKFAIDFLDYYDNPERGQHPNSTGYYSYTSLAPMMNFFPVRTDRDHIAATGTIHRGRKRCISLLLGRRIRKSSRTERAV